MSVRIRRHLGTVLVILLVATVPSPLAGQPAKGSGEIKGRIVQAGASRPPKDPVVLIEELPALVAPVAEDGSFHFTDVPPGHYHLLATASGFASLRFEIQVPDAGAPLEIELVPAPHYSEVVSVTGSPKDQFIAYQASSVLAGQDLAIDVEGSLGAALRSQPGIAERSFGPAPSRPIIRGLDGDRVLILEDGRRTGDLSSQSGDHGVVVNPAAASRLEVIRGPGALLYGGNAIGGIVNVISERIPVRPMTGVDGRAQLDFATGASDGGAAADVQVGNGAWALRFGGSGRSSGDVRTPEAEIDNTQSRSGMGDVGLSWTNVNGYVGGAYQYDDSRYGVPVIEEGLVELTPRRHSFTLKGERRGMTGWLSGVRGSFAFRDYTHDELVAGVAETTFDNTTSEADLLLNHAPYGRLKGTMGGWGLVRQFSVLGEEALSPPVDQDGFALFLFEELTWPHVTLQFGGRYDRATFDVRSGELPDRHFDNGSASVGLLLRPSDNTTLAISLARAARNPALEELYYFGPHPGNFAFEIGNPTLASEKALGIDLSFRWRLKRLSGEVTYFRNDIADFIFREPVSEDELDGVIGEDHDHGAHDDLPVVRYVGADSLLQGFEAHVDLDVATGLSVEFGLDSVRGELTDTNAPLPRMPPFRVLGGLHYQRSAFQVGGEVTAVADQDRIYPPETPTDGYALLKLFGSWSFVRAGVVNTITARLDNVTDELYRNHLSLIKDFVPEMGRSFKVVYSIEF